MKRRSGATGFFGTFKFFSNRYRVTGRADASRDDAGHVQVAMQARADRYHRSRCRRARRPRIADDTRVTLGLQATDATARGADAGGVDRAPDQPEGERCSSPERCAAIRPDHGEPPGPGSERVMHFFVCRVAQPVTSRQGSVAQSLAGGQGKPRTAGRYRRRSASLGHNPKGRSSGGAIRRCAPCQGGQPWQRRAPWLTPPDDLRSTRKRA